MDIRQRPEKIQIIGASHEFYIDHQSILCSPTSGGWPLPRSRVSQASLCQAAENPRHRQPGATLTSLYHSAEAGDYGDRGYPGNCGGNLIKDLLTYFRPSRVFDPMAGSGTCRDVCDELGIPCMAWDIHQGYDACDPASAPAAESFDFVWAHPAYWRMKLYADDPRDFSRAATLEAFLVRYGQFIRNAGQA